MNRACTKLLLGLLLMGAACMRVSAEDVTNAPAPVTARDFYNEGTRLLAAKKFDDAERMLHSALAAQDEQLQPAAMFNLGHARFSEGAEILQKGDPQKTSAQGNSALGSAQNAIQQGEAALAGAPGVSLNGEAVTPASDQLEKLVEAYIQGRGARRNLRAAEKAVKEALDNYGKTLARWQRADDDFKGAAELDAVHTNAQHNAAVVEQDIARLVDSIRKMQQMMAAMGAQKGELDKTLAKLKGKIPGENAPPGGKGDDDDEDGNGSGHGDVKPESLTGKEENANREGQEYQVPLSPEQVGQILDGLPVDSGKPLPVGGDQESPPPADRKGRIW